MANKLPEKFKEFLKSIDKLSAGVVIVDDEVSLKKARRVLKKQGIDTRPIKKHIHELNRQLLAKRQ